MPISTILSMPVHSDEFYDLVPFSVYERVQYFYAIPLEPLLIG